MKRSYSLGLAALSLAALACTCGGLLSPRAILPGEVQEGVEELEALATDFEFEEFEEGLEDLEQLEESLDLAADFPSDFPLPADMTVETAFELDGAVNAVLTYEGTVEEAVTNFEAALTEAGYTIDSREEITTSVGATILWEFSGPSYSGDITMAGMDGALGIQISLIPNP